MNPNLALWGGLSLSFNPNLRNLENVKVLAVGLENQNRIRASVEGTYTRTDINEGKSSLWTPSVRAQFDCQALHGNRQLASVEYVHNVKPVNWSVANETKLDNATRLKVRVNQNYTLSGALIHSFSNLATFALTANVFIFLY